MSGKCVLILEDSDDRINRFKSVLKKVDYSRQVEIWRNAERMIQEVDALLASARLISLDHDLDQAASETRDPGNGLIAAKFLATRSPSCPVIIHSSNIERSYMMDDELRATGWTSKRVVPLGDDWVEAEWSGALHHLLGIGS